MKKDRSEYHKKYYQDRKEMLRIAKEAIEAKEKEKDEQLKQPSVNIVRHIQPEINNEAKPMQERVFAVSTTESTDVKSVYRWFIYLALGIFLILNTSFLVNEQIRFYELKRYSFSYSLFVSVLCESAVILLSFFFAQSKIIFHRIVIGFVLFLTVACILSIIYLGVDKTQSEGEKNKEVSTLLRKEVDRLAKEVEDEVTPKKSMIASLSKKEKELSDFLQKHDILSSGIETFSLIILRGLSFAWNVIFSVLIAFVFQEKYAK